MNKHSFASRLSFKTVAFGVITFIVTLTVVSLVGGEIIRKRSVSYSHVCLQKSVLEVESTINSIEDVTDAVALTTEEYLSSGTILDTSRCFELLEKIVASSPHILGSGFYFEPYKYVKTSSAAGIYAQRDKETGDIYFEWDDDDTNMIDDWDYFSLDWYSLAKESGANQWTPPALENMTTYYQLMTTYTFPIVDRDGKFFGVLATDLSLDFLENQLIANKPYENSNVIVVDKDLRIICNPLYDNPLGMTLLDTPFIPGFSNTATDDIQTQSQDALIVKEGFFKRAFVISEQMENGWLLAVAIPFKAAFFDLNRLLLIILIVAIVGSALLFFFSRRIIRRESKPISDFAVAASKITDGRFDVPIPEVKNEDEIKELGNALTFMQESVTNYIAELKSTTAEKERLASELNVAHAIQSSMLTKEFPSADSCHIYANSIPAREVGGDLYDFFVSGDDMYFILGDVAGKGVPAALLMAITIAAFRASVKKVRSTSEIVSLINETFCKSNEDMMFVTLVVCRLNMPTGRLEFCNAGHNPMLLVDSDGKARFLKEKANLVCGTFPDFVYESETLTLDGGSRLLLYSDGVTEAEAVDKSQFGEPRLLDWAGRYYSSLGNSDENCVSNLAAEVKKFTDGALQNDDITMMSVTRLNLS